MIREAINELKKYTLGKKNTEKVEISVLQLNRVIKALEQEPCSDAISRQAVLDILQKYKLGESKIAEDVNDLPPVNPQPRTGHWIDHQEGEWIYAKCSECGSIHDTATNYCPECGCLMDRTEFDEYVKTEGA